MSWIRMLFKGERVWVRADESGKPELDGSGRAEMKYRESDNKSYRPFAGNLLPDEGGHEAPSHARASAGAHAKTSHAKTSHEKTSHEKASHEKTSHEKASHAKASHAKASHDGGRALEIWTDGACSGNPGPMGIGIVAIDGGKRKEHGQYLGVGTNNIAELTAIDRALDLIGDDARTRRLRIYTDSAYSIGVLSKGWKAKANQELIARMRRRLAGLPDVEFVKVSGHAGVPENERCDELARDAISGR